ncbi:MAG TPA: rod shape-determining protein MreD [Chloroflexia bacterium]|nr:rod shape-determining protein MreD [Chloroflexia bacterium]
MVYLGAVILFIAGIIQTVVLPQLVPISARPHLVVLLVVAVCLAESLYDAVIWGFMGGIMLDLMGGAVLPIGSNALLLVLIALLASLGQANPFHSLLFVPLITVFAATFFYHVMVMALAAALGNQVAFVDNVLRVALPSAALNAALMPVAYTSLLWLSEKIGRRVRVEW